MGLFQSALKENTQREVRFGPTRRRKRRAGSWFGFVYILIRVYDL